MPLLVLPTQGSQLPGGSLPAALAAAGSISIEPVDGPAESWEARVCAGISAAEIGTPAIGTEPLRILAIGDAALTLPAIARANRSCGRHIAEYVLLEPDLPATTEAWPDAPVIVFADDPSIERIAGLRGWEVEKPHALPAWLSALSD